MHIAAANPEFLERSEVPEAVVAKEKELAEVRECVCTCQTERERDRESCGCKSA